MSRIALVVALLALVGAADAAAEVVAPGVQDGMLALGPSGRPVVGYVRGGSVEVARRGTDRRWRTGRIAGVAAGSKLVGFATGPAGVVALVESFDERRLLVVRQVGPGWQVTRLVTALQPGFTLGWPGLALDAHGLPAVAYTRWRSETHKSTLVLAVVGQDGRPRSRQITSQGFPKSHVAPPASPVFSHGVLHVVESYGFDGAVGTIQWSPRGRGWGGQFLDSGIGDYPVGPLLAAVGATGTVYAAWTEALLGTGEYPLLLAARGREIESNVVLDRALTTSLVAAASGVVVGANEWVTASELGLENDGVAWAGTISSRGRRSELDGRLAALAYGAHATRDVLLAGPRGLSWFRSPAAPSVRVRLSAGERADGSVLVSGRVLGYRAGRVRIYRERPGSSRVSAAALRPSADGFFTFVDRHPRRPLLYRAVYIDRRTGVPYAALLRRPLF